MFARADHAPYVAYQAQMAATHRAKEHSTSVTNVPPDRFADRQQKERKGLDEFGVIANRIATMRRCHRWLFTAHDAYNAVGRRGNRGAIDSSTLRTY
jgi:hypothetical protein